MLFNFSSIKEFKNVSCVALIFKICWITLSCAIVIHGDGDTDNNFRQNEGSDFGAEQSEDRMKLDVTTTTSTSLPADMFDGILPEYACGPVPIKEDMEVVCKLPETSFFSKCQTTSPVWTEAEIRCKKHGNFARSDKVIKIKCIDGQSWQPTPNLTCQRDADLTTPALTTCGLVPAKVRTTRVANGQTAPSRSFPWHAAVFVKHKGKIIYARGATLIHPRLVITSGVDVSNLGASNIIVVLNPDGRNFEKNKADKRAQLHQVKKIHTPIKSNGEKANVVVLQLTQAVHFNDFVLPACLPTSLNDPAPGTIGQFPGFGMNEHNKYPEALNFVSLPFVHLAECFRTPGISLSVDEFCAGYKNGTGTCAGDSGGGLVFLEDDRYVIKGVLSTTTEKKKGRRTTCEPKNYSVFTSILFYLDWISGLVKIAEAEDVKQTTKTNVQPGTADAPELDTTDQEKSLSWMANIYQSYQGSYLYACAGTVIHPKVIITAATCFSMSTKPEDFRVFINPTHCGMSGNAADATPIFASVDSIVLHPNFSSFPGAGFVHNLALAKLSFTEGSSKNQPVTVASIAQDETHAGQSTKIVGCFLMPNATASELTEDKMTVLNERECMRFNAVKPPDGQFCASSNMSVIPPKRFGSVGFVEKKKDQKGVSLKAVFSSGFDDKQLPSYFTSVGRYKQWIDSTVRSLVPT